MDKNFHIVVPAELEKSSDGEWRVRGLASTASRDQQGEIILQQGIDLTPIDQGRGVLNFDHLKGPENTIGLLDGYSKRPEGIYVEGRLFKNHSKAKAVYEIMSSLGKSDRGRVGLSVEGKILERAGKDGKIIKKCQINAVALTMNPVNQDTYVDLVKSMTESNTEVDWSATQENQEKQEVEFQGEPSFTASQVMQLLEKALTAGAGYTKVPTERSGGEALSQQEIDKTPKKLDTDEDWDSREEKKKKLKKMCKGEYVSKSVEVLDLIQKLYPDYSRAQIWTVVKDRLNKKFDNL